MLLVFAGLRELRDCTSGFNFAIPMVPWPSTWKLTTDERPHAGGSPARDSPVKEPEWHAPSLNMDVNCGLARHFGERLVDQIAIACTIGSFGVEWMFVRCGNILWFSHYTNGIIAVLRIGRDGLILCFIFIKLKWHNLHSQWVTAFGSIHLLEVPLKENYMFHVYGNWSCRYWPVSFHIK